MVIIPHATGGWMGGNFPITPAGQTAEHSEGSGASEEDQDIFKVLEHTRKLVLTADKERGRCPS